MSQFIMLLLAAGAFCVYKAWHQPAPLIPAPPPPPPKPEQYPITVTIGSVVIHQLIFADVPLPFRPLLGRSRGEIESGIGNAPVVHLVDDER